MKKIFTLIAGMLLISSGAFAQDKWTSVITNGDMEGAADPMWSSFWVHDWRTPEQVGEFNPESGQQFDESSQTELSAGQFQGFAEIVADPANPSNHCARVIIRSKAEADSLGNPTTDSGNNKPDWTEWDSQFFIYALDTIPQGKEVRLTLKIKAEKAGSLQTQAHFNPGNYNHYSLFGDINYTTEWSTVEVSATVDANHTQAANGKGFQSVAFNLSTMQDGNVIYFDDVKLEIKDPKTIDPDQPGKWINFLRKGTLSEDKVGNFTTFTGRMGATNADEKAILVNDAKDGEPALTVQTVAWNAEAVLKDSEGKDSIGADSTIVIAHYYIVDGDTILSSDSRDKKSFDDWRTQFFVTINHKFVTNEPFKFKMWGRVERVDGQPLEEDITLQTQFHGAPGGYLHWQCVGDVVLNDEWQMFEFGDDETPITVPSEAKGAQTIAFNCNTNKNYPVNIYFRFEEFDVNDSYVVDNDRVLATGDAIMSVGTNQDGIGAGKLDLTEAMKVLEIDNFDNYIDNTKMKVQALNTDEEVIYNDVDLSAGAFINADGFWQESDEKAIILEIDEDNTGDGILAFITTNNGVTIDEKGIATKFAFEKDGWRYLFNVNILDPEAYDRAQGISEVNVAPKANAIFDLMGRQLTKAGKGLYIMNGKKVLVK
jgi:hypothetical protein